MVIVCPGCRNQITLDEGTLPAGSFKVRCTGCGRMITAQRASETPPPPPPVESIQQPPPAATITDKIKTVSSGTFPRNPEGSAKIQADPVRQDILEAMKSLLTGPSPAATEDKTGSMNALICSSDPHNAQTASAVLQSMGYSTEITISVSESLKELDDMYPLIVVDSGFSDDPDGGRRIISKINACRATERRQTFVVLLSATQKTLDGNSAFLSGVNLVVNRNDIASIDKPIREGQKNFQKMYTIFNRITLEKQRMGLS